MPSPKQSAHSRRNILVGPPLTRPATPSSAAYGASDPAGRSRWAAVVLDRQALRPAADRELQQIADAGPVRGRTRPNVELAGVSDARLMSIGPGDPCSVTGRGVVSRLILADSPPQKLTTARNL